MSDIENDFYLLKAEKDRTIRKLQKEIKILKKYGNQFPAITSSSEDENTPARKSTPTAMKRKSKVDYTESK